MNTLPLFPQDDNPILKKCPTCPEGQQWHPATSEFFHKDGFFPRCKVCVKAYNDSQKEYRKQRYQERRDQEREYRKKNYQEHREERLEKAKKRNQENREQRLEKQRQYRKDHPDVLREQEKRKREKHKDKIRERKKAWQQSDVYKEYQKRYQKEKMAEIREWRKQNYTVHAEEVRERQRRYGKSQQGRLVDRAHKHKRRAQKAASGGSHTAQQVRDQLKRQKSKCYYCKTKLGKDGWHEDHVVPLSRGGSNDISNIVIACPSCNLRKQSKLPHEWTDGGRLL